MSSKNKTLKLTIPNDIGEEEIFINHRQKLIEERLLNSYASEIALIITSFVVKNCNGHPSQRQHPCLMMETDERLCLYFDQAIDLVCEATVAEHFVNNLQDIKPTVNGFGTLKYAWTGEKCFAQERDDNLRIKLENCYNNVFFILFINVFYSIETIIKTTFINNYCCLEIIQLPIYCKKRNISY